MRSFDRPVDAVVVGARTGIGAAVVDELRERGAARIIATSRDFEEKPRKIDPVTKEGATVELRFAVDPGQKEDLRSLRQSLRQAEIRPNLVLVTCGVLQDLSGGIAPEKRLDALAAESMVHSYQVNAVVPMLALQALAPLQARGERFVAAVLSARVGSIGDNRLGGWYSYRMSKAALNMGVHTAAIELARRNPRSVCVALHPGTVETELSKPFVKSNAERTVFSAKQAAAQLLDVIEGLGEDDSGGFFAWDGSSIAW